MADVKIRRLAASDSYEELTALLHRAYKRLADMGLKYMATHQSPDVTRDRADGGECYVAVDEEKIIGTICFYRAEETEGSPWYDRHDVASFGQYAVEPNRQGEGIGSLLLSTVERRALESGATEIALDTSEDASHLIDLYAAKGYRFIETVRWTEVNYRSVVMSKSLR